MKIKHKLLSIVVPTVTAFSFAATIVSCSGQNTNTNSETPPVAPEENATYCQVTFSSSTTTGQSATITGQTVQQIKAGKTLATLVLPVASLSGYNFKYWAQKTSSGTYEEVSASTIINNNLTLYPCFDHQLDYLCFHPVASCGKTSISGNIYGTLSSAVDLEWSYDGINWKTFLNGTSGAAQSVTINLDDDRTDNDKVYIKNNENTLSASSDNYFRFTVNNYTTISGSCNSLINSSSLSNYCFYGLFLNCWNLLFVNDELLPATTLANYCYYSMFQGCTSLTTAPALPARALASYCYRNMFSDCTSLTMAPDLPSKTLVNYCYFCMFSGCTSLTTAPELPATTLAPYCYGYMFQGCTSLKTAPALTATTLVSNCYTAMFCNCTSLTTAPALPATTLSDYCYYTMFYGCRSLKAAPSLPVTTLSNGCYSQMFSGCSSLLEAPYLPATALTNSCYANMFRDCTSLTTAPALPATTLVESCYENMFRGCTSLITAPALPATKLANYCYYFMFSGCANLKINTQGTGTKIFTCPSTSSISNPVGNMFSSTGGSFEGTPTSGKTYYYY